ncbi:MAG: hypothetical protein MUP28_10875, partial [Candidatus Aminicenantes bacterium]|nr:hypothetical protein [Candidatus Aminicenantes bacterium]
PNILSLEKRYKEIGVPADLVEKLAVSPFASLFEKAVGEWGMRPALVSVVLAQYPARLKKKGFPADTLDEGSMTSVLAALKERRIYREGVLPLLEQALADRKKVEDLWPSPADDAKVRANVRATAENMKGRRFRREAARELLAMGRLMDEWRGRVDGAELAARLKEALEGTAR